MELLFFLVKSVGIYKKDPIKKYYEKNNSPYVAYILFKSQCCCGLRLDALDTYMTLLQQCSRKRDVYTLRSRENYSSDLINNLQNIGFFEKLEKKSKK